MKLAKSLILADESVCSLFCIRESLHNFPAVFDRTKQRNARVVYAFLFAAMSAICLCTKFFAETIFVGAYSRLVCYTRTLIHTCFQLQVIYRLAVSFAIFHIVLMGNALRKRRSSVDFNDLFWMPKLLFLLGLFVISLYLPNVVFSVLSSACKYVSVFAVFAQTVLLNDALFFCFNKRRFAARAGEPFSRGWKIFIYLGGIISFCGGIALFVFCFLRFARICPQYVAITGVLMGVAGLIVLLTTIKYQFRQEVNACFVMFLVFAAMTWGILSATPYSACINKSNVDLVYSAATAGAEAALNAFFVFCCLLFLALANAQDVALTMSLHGPWLYDLLLIDRGQRGTRKGRRDAHRELLLGAANTREAALGIVDEGLNPNRPRNDFYFHLLLAIFALYLAMISTNWTSLYGFDFLVDDIVDRRSLWVRFAGTLAGLVYVLAFLVSNLGLTAKY